MPISDRGCCVMASSGIHNNHPSRRSSADDDSYDDDDDEVDSCAQVCSTIYSCGRVTLDERAIDISFSRSVKPTSSRNVTDNHASSMRSAVLTSRGETTDLRAPSADVLEQKTFLKGKQFLICYFLLVYCSATNIDDHVGLVTFNSNVGQLHFSIHRA